MASARQLSVCAVVLLVAVLGHAAARQSANFIAVTNVTVIDVVSGQRQSGTRVLTRDGLITSIGPRTPVPVDAMWVDGTGKFLVPGLWDMHSHNQVSGADSLDLYLANGVVGTRDMGADLEFILPLRDRIRRGDAIGPELIVAGPILDNAPPDWPFRRRVTNAGEARDAVRDLRKRGVDFLKVHNHTPRDAFFAIAEEATKAGLMFAGHVPLAVTLDEAATSGIRSIEHLSEFRVFRECAGKVQPYDAGGCRPLFDKLAENNIWQTPTIAFYRVLADVFSAKPMPHAEYASDSLLEVTRKIIEGSKLDDQAMAFLRSMSATSLTVIRDMLSRGVGFLAGCDGGVPGFCLHDELERLTEAGLSPLQALQSATVNPARTLGLEKSQGTIEVGKRADLLLLEADPLVDVGNARRIAAVVARGRLLLKADIERILSAHRRVSGQP
jgi:imidazolonepropionase-like amidohydrolase